jgi:3'-phosphoadenosine 5'-phosphosulfate sulfotransferase (PAPS reductase)/FAD synthetase
VALVRTDVSEERSTCVTVFLCSMLRLLVTVNVVPSSPILTILTMEAVRSSVTSVLTRDTRHNISETAFFKPHAMRHLKTEFPFLLVNAVHK